MQGIIPTSGGEEEESSKGSEWSVGHRPEVQQVAYPALGQQWSDAVSDRVSDWSSNPDLPASTFSVMCKLF